jgi:hypothetical protein
MLFRGSSEPPPLNLARATKGQKLHREARGDEPGVAFYLRIEERELEAGGLNEPARLTSHQPVSAGTAAAQKSSLRPVEPLTTPRKARNSPSDGSVGVPP